MGEQFASDNYAGMCPAALEYLGKANGGHVGAYGRDPWTEKAGDALRELFETDCVVFFVTTGTAANALALASLCPPYRSVICHETSHVQTDECGAPEFFTGGSKLQALQGLHGKLTAEPIEALAGAATDVHWQKPGAVSLTQLTELGTRYSVEELATIGATARRHGLRLHMDGARFANAVAGATATPAELSWRQGVDVLCLGGSKNGLGLGEAILFFDRDLAADFGYRCKQAGQIVAKMRFLAAAWLGLLESGAWLANARHANACAAYLETRLRQTPGADVVLPREGNAVFVKLPEPVIRYLRARDWRFYDFFAENVVRLMCSWNSTTEGIDRLLADLDAGFKASGGPLQSP